MGSQKILVGPLTKGLRNDVTAFNVDNESFPVLLNAYQWRSRIKRKRGTSLVGRLTKFFDSQQVAFNPGAGLSPPVTTQTLANGSGNLLTGFQGAALSNHSSLKAGDIYILSSTTAAYSDTDGDGKLYTNPGGVESGTVDYGTGIIVLTPAPEASATITANFNYFPELPVLGLEPFIEDASDFPRELCFDQTHSYSMSLFSPFAIHNTSFYYNPTAASPYVPKSIISPYGMTPLKWNLKDYQQMWTTNFSGALWASGGIPSPFVDTNIGMQFQKVNLLGTPASRVNDTTMLFEIDNCPLVVGDWVFVNEFVSATAVTPPNSTQLNFQTGYVTVVTPGVDPLVTITVVFPTATIPADTYTLGMVQYLTNQSDSTKDCIRWYNGNPVTTAIPGGTPNLQFTNLGGWVNFCPPLTTGNVGTFSVGDLPPLQYYLVGARMIVPFKDRLLFLGPVVQASTGGAKYLQDTIIYSQNGTPYYTASFPGSVSTTTDYTEQLVPLNQTAQPSAFFENQAGFGGFISAGYARPITSVSPNEDALIVGFADRQARVLYTGNDVIPFNFYIINSELGSEGTFSTVTLDRGVLSQGGRGFILTSQIESQRIDLDVPNEIFQVRLQDQGSRRVAAQRDFINEWVYFTYPSNKFDCRFPTRTLQYNYREGTWGVFNESYTTYGLVRFQDGDTWATIGSKYSTWSKWNDPWNAGTSTPKQPQVLAGNQQGYVLRREEGTGEGKSLNINNIFIPLTGTGIGSSSTFTGITSANPCVITAVHTYTVGQTVTINSVPGMTELNGNTYKIIAVTGGSFTLSLNSTGFTPYIGPSGGESAPTPQIYCPDHCLNDGDFITIENVEGDVAPQFNEKVFLVGDTTTLGFKVTRTDKTILTQASYLGGGQVIRYYIPFIQTKQFPVYWDMGRKTRIGNQMYLFSGTAAGQVSILLYLSQNADSPYNAGPIVPRVGSTNNALIYSQLLETTTEQYIQSATNAPLGEIGNGVDTIFILKYGTLFGFSGPLVRGSVVIRFGTNAVFQDDGLGTFTVTGVTATGTINYITKIIVLTFAVAPVATLSLTNYRFFYPNIQTPTDGAQKQIWHQVSTSLIGDTVQIGITLSDEQMSDASRIIQTSEIELHSFILDVFPSQFLA